MSELPAGWVRTCLGQLGEWSSGGTPSRKHPEYFGGQIPWVKTGDLRDDLIMDVPEGITHAGLDNSAAKLFPAGTLLVAMYGATIGKTGLLGRAAATNQACAALLPLGGAEDLIPFVWKFLIGNTETLRNYGQGGAQPNISQEILKQVEINLPPLPEQGRIVAKFDSLAAYCSRARHELDRIPKMVERYKRAILDKAFIGELTVDIRALSGSLQSGERDAARMGLNDNERGTWEISVLPEGWAWRKFSSFFVDETDSTRKLQQKAYDSEGEFPVIDQGERFIGGYTSDSSLVSTSTPPIILFGDHTRCVKYVDFKFVQGADGTKIFKPADGIEPRYAYFALLALNLPDKGYSRHMKFLRESLFPYCSLGEQQEIVRRIESAFTWLDSVAVEHERAQHLLPKLDQAILTKALCGELVPQDPNDEPAAKLLERIRAEHGKRPQRRGRAKGRKPVGALAKRMKNAVNAGLEWKL